MSLTFKSVDTMKTSRDANPALSNANIVAHCNALNRYFPDATHYTVASYQNNFSFYTIAKVNEWFDAVHATGKKVFFRPALTAQMPTYAVDGATASTMADYITIFKASVHNFNWVNGDCWDVWPESNPNAAIYGNVAGWNQFVRDTITALNSEFSGINKTVDCTFWSGTDQQAIFQTKLEAETVTATGKVCIDFYPIDYIGAPGKGSTIQKVNNFVNQVATAHTNYPTADIYITEIGYNNTTLVGDEDQREVLRFLFNETSKISYIKGLNYWHVAGNTEYDKCLIFQDDSLTEPRAAAAVLGEYFTKGICNSRLKLI